MKISLVMLFDPIPKGVLLSFGGVAVSTVGLTLVLETLAPASPQLLENIALIGASLVLAYVIEAVWLVSRVEIDDDPEEWLGFITGTGITSLVGIALALITAAHRAAGHDTLFDSIGLAWAVTSLTILGIVLILQPLLADRYGDSDLAD